MFERWADELVMGTPTDALDGLDGYVDLMIADRCFRTTDDLLSDLITIGVDGEDLTSDEIMLAVRTMLLLARRAEIAEDQQRRAAS